MRTPPHPPGDRDRPRRLAGRQRPPDQGDARGPRKRGGQPGNVNALKHGLYARTLSPAALRALQVARGLKSHNLDEEIATVRAKLSDLPPHERQAFLQGVALLVRAVHTNYRMNPKATKDLADNITQLLNSLGDQLLPPQD